MMMENDKYCELHVHLEGCVWKGHIARWWNKSGYLFEPPRYSSDRCFARFLEHIRFGYNFLNLPEAYAAVVCDYARQAIHHGIVYAELQINLALLNTWGLDIEEVLDVIVSEADKLVKKPVLRFIVDLPWQFSAKNFETILNRKSTLTELGVVGISMGGEEHFARINEVGQVFEEARKLGFKTLCHAGELTDTGFARELIETLQPDRVAHAITIADWISEMGPNAPPIDVCLTSNLLTGVINNYDKHPLLEWYKSGVSFSLSTDDPAIFNINLANEFAIAKKMFPELQNDLSWIKRGYLAGAFDIKSAKKALGLNV